MPTPPGDRRQNNPNFASALGGGFRHPGFGSQRQRGVPLLTYAGGPSSGFSMYSPSFSVPSTSFHTS